MLPALRLHLLDLQVGGFLAQLRLAGVERHLEIEGIDDVEHISLVNILVVDDPNFRDLPRHLRRDSRDLHANRAVARPGRGHIGIPDHQRGQYSEDEDQKGRRCLERFPSETGQPAWAFGRRQTLSRIRVRRTRF